ncbi:MAG: HAMP domain-containing histidine kinase [Faecalibacterium sp.]|nr:HAMP domain-containing histidine kinase [Ruminococcus sp.]MCM1391848.1 HAMP domain-containing histidine kinase [Ruminococcus sp.]MCM1485712.1 HAMP domain-containing histidine kinase [Faecalibacterium sp.]
MKIMRNPEFKRSAVIISVISSVLILIGFIVNIRCGLYTSAVCIIFITVSWISAAARYEKMRFLTDSIDNILHGKSDFTISEVHEGELSILENEIKKMIIRLREQAEELQKQKIYLSDSIADISHQLRTPLTSINLALSLLQAPDITEDRRIELINELTKLTRRIDRLVTTLLKISKIDAGTVTFEQKEVSVEELISKSSEPLAIMLDVREQTMELDIRNETYTGDLAWTIEAIGNILKNCSEHTPIGGKISVSACETPVFTEIIITDNGCGFEKDDIPHLFERFYKGKNSSVNSFGIGLSLAQAVIIGQNGTIKASNARGGGARFTIRFYKTTV